MTTFGNKGSGGGGDDEKGGGGMSRAAKKRLKKKQKAQAQALAAQQQQEQQQQVKKQKKTKRKSSGSDDDGASFDVREEEEEEERRERKRAKKQAKKKKTEKMTLLESDDDDDDQQHSFDDVEQGEDMQIAEVSRGELDYLESQGVKVTKKKKKSKKKRDKAENGHRGGDDSDGGSSGQGEYDDDDAAGVTTEEEREEKEILLSLAQNLTPSQVLFPGNSVDADGDEHASEEDGVTMDPRRILQDLTSASRARVLFESLLAPSGVTADEFYRTYWEKKPLLITKPRVSFATENSDNGGGGSKAAPQNHKTRLDNILSKKDIETMLAKCSLRYGRELNVTRYADAGDGSRTKRRITLDLPPKRVKKKPGKSSGQGEEDLQPVVADPKDVWSNFVSGCTVRLLCPHLHSDSVHSLLSTLELEFGCMVGSNAYLTPGGDSQGFAPHYDDIEAFILQLEGRKRWRVYPPPNKAETLPRISSRDYTEEDMEGTAPFIDTVLEPGDILYMPRGWIHQAHTPPSRGGESQGGGGHSLHLTASAMQQWAWADLLDIIMPEAFEAVTASETSTSLREGLPRNFVNYMGAMYDTSNDDDAPEGLKQASAKRDDMDEDEYEELVRQRKMKRMQNKFCEEANKRIMRVCKEAMTLVNASCDQIGKRFLSDRQPPALTPNEAVLTSEHREESGGKIWPNTMCRLARPGIARLVLEDDKAVLYHCADNSRVYRGTPLSPLEFEVDDAPALEMLLTTTEPHWICVKDLIHGDIEDKMEIAQSLYDEGILAILQTDKPDRTVQTG